MIKSGMTDADCKDLSWQLFCQAHPHEAYVLDPDAFWKVFHAEHPGIARQQMVALLKETEETVERSFDE